MVIDSRDWISIVYLSMSTRMTGGSFDSVALGSSILDARSANWCMMPDIDWLAWPLAGGSNTRVSNYNLLL